MAPVWTRSRLERVMCLRFGFGHDQVSPDTAAAAAAMGVTRRTLQRWLHAEHGRSVAHIPVKRLEQLTKLLLPQAETLAHEEQQARYAYKAIDGLRLPRKMGIKPAWEKQRWPETHRVVVLQIPVGHLRIRQLAIARDEPSRVAEVARRGNGQHPLMGFLAPELRSAGIAVEGAVPKVELFRLDLMDQP